MCMTAHATYGTESLHAKFTFAVSSKELNGWSGSRWPLSAGGRERDGVPAERTLIHPHLP